MTVNITRWDALDWLFCILLCKIVMWPHQWKLPQNEDAKKKQNMRILLSMQMTSVMWLHQ